MNVTLCSSCALGQAGFADILQAACLAHGLKIAVALIDCMSGCARASTVAFRSPGKTAYLFGDITAQDLPDLINFSRLYKASPDGNFADARELGALRTKAIARIPA